MMWILIGESQCHIQFPSLAYGEGVLDFNVVLAILQGLLKIYYIDLKLLRSACYQKYLKDVS